jgi:uncharacterized protein YcsI (UPF0317 family)
MNMSTLRKYKNKYCNLCNHNCDHCKVKNFVNYVGLQETPHDTFNNLMRANVPTDVRYQNGKHVQQHGNIVK